MSDTVRPGIVLIGYRGTGKTVVGMSLAELISVDHVDTDILVTDMAGQSVSSIFGSEGEEKFREWESKALTEALAVSGRVVSVGGGAVLSIRNRLVMKTYGRVVWLDASPAVLWARIQQDAASGSERPDLAGGGLNEVVELSAKRLSLYLGLADVRIDVTTRTVAEIAAQIAAWLDRDHAAGEFEG